MAVPNDEPIPFLKLARERRGFGFDSSNTINYPIYLSDLSRLTGGNTSGSGDSYPAINQNNPEGQKPDGQNPLGVGEFKLYEQNYIYGKCYKLTIWLPDSCKPCC